MTIFTPTQVQQNFEAILEQALREGQVAIRSEDGRQFVLRPVSSTRRSGFDIPGVSLGLSADDIVRAVRESRER